MSYREFTFPEVETKLGLTVSIGRFLPVLTPVVTSADFLQRLHEGTELALGIDTEKARSEFIVAPILLEFRRLCENRHAIYSGVEFNVDASKGLNGFCDFLITRSPRLYILTAPVIAVAEAKNDNAVTGVAQCIAAMRAAWLFNIQKGSPVTQVFGAATTGTNWKFLRLRDVQVDLDPEEIHLRDVAMILAILLHMADAA